MNGKKCSDCFYCLFDMQIKVIICRRYPPKMILTENGYKSIFTRVKESDFCGEFIDRNEYYEKADLEKDLLFMRKRRMYKRKYAEQEQRKEKEIDVWKMLNEKPQI